ncbi:MAG TPA: endolytic transglycosylase MltG [Bacilli bacterium]|nr:endolytic transglycosylase MltG [Bacilli bacterium]
MSNSNDHKNTKQIQSQDNEEKLAVNNKPYINKRRQNFIERCRDASIVRKIVFIVIILFTVLIVYGAKSAYEFISTGLSPVDPESEETIEVDIPLGSSSKGIAEILEEEGLINNQLIYRLFIKVNNYANFQAGAYQLSPSMTLAEISEILQTGSVARPALYTVTIPEGRTIEEIATLYENNANIDAEEFLELMNDEEYITSLIDLYPNLLSEEILQDEIRYPLEGYLFAATYPIFDETPEIDTLVRMMLDKSADVISEYYSEILELEEFTVHDIVTFASLVEREARNEEERKLISGVFYNRLDEGMRLETDPTVLYALGEHKDRVLFKDLEIESPYNTYHVYGLPIGPISNFGVSSLESVFYPTETSYKFFVAAPDGQIYFSETHKEHVNLANKYLDRDVE